MANNTTNTSVNNAVKNASNTKFWNRKRTSLVFYVAMMALPIIQFILMYFCVNANSILLAFKEYTAEGTYVWLERPFQNFQNVFDEISQAISFKYAIKNSLVVAACSLVLNIPLSLVFSYYIFKEMPCNKFFRVALYLPNIVSSIVMVTIYMYIMENAIPELSAIITGGKEPDGLLSNPNTAFACLIGFSVIFSFGSMTMVFSSTMSSISESVIEAAKLDGCNLFQEFFYIIFPLIFNVIKLRLISLFVGIFTAQLNLYTFFDLNADPSLYTIGYYLYRGTMASGPSGYPFYATMGLVLTLVAMPVVLSVRKIFDKFDPFME